MTSGKLLSMALGRAGQWAPDTPTTNRARDYLNIIKTEVETLEDWRFLYIASSITTTADTRSYSLDADVLYPLDFWDYTNNKKVQVKHPEEITELDPDEDDTGEALIVAVTGRNTTTGYWEVDIYPTPDTSSETIKYRYKAFIADFDSDDDNTDMAPKYPAWLQNALLWGTSALLLEAGNDFEKAKPEWEKYTRSVEFGKGTNRTISVPPKIVMGRDTEMGYLRIVGGVTPD